MKLPSFQHHLSLEKGEKEGYCIVTGAMHEKKMRKGSLMHH